jgi:hypothetical protein
MTYCIDDHLGSNDITAARSFPAALICSKRPLMSFAG